MTNTIYLIRATTSAERYCNGVQNITFFKKLEVNVDTLNKEFWEKRDAAMKRFMASKERKRKRMAELEQMLRQDYLARTGEEPKFVNVW